MSLAVLACALFTSFANKVCFVAWLIKIVLNARIHASETRFLKVDFFSFRVYPARLWLRSNVVISHSGAISFSWPWVSTGNRLQAIDGRAHLELAGIWGIYSLNYDLFACSIFTGFALCTSNSSAVLRGHDGSQSYGGGEESHKNCQSGSRHINIMIFDYLPVIMKLFPVNLLYYKHFQLQVTRFDYSISLLPLRLSHEARISWIFFNIFIGLSHAWFSLWISKN